jgi:hypothetical protein
VDETHAYYCVLNPNAPSFTTQDIYRIKKDGSGSPEHLAAQSNAEYGLYAIDTNAQKAYWLDQGVRVYDKATGALDRWPVVSTVADAQALGVDADGVWVADSSCQGLTRYDPVSGKSQFSKGHKGNIGGGVRLRFTLDSVYCSNASLSVWKKSDLSYREIEPLPRTFIVPFDILDGTIYATYDSQTDGSFWKGPLPGESFTQVSAGFGWFFGGAVLADAPRQSVYLIPNGLAAVWTFRVKDSALSKRPIPYYLSGGVDHDDDFVYAVGGDTQLATTNRLVRIRK